MSERRACKTLGQARAVQRYTPLVRTDEKPLTGRIVELAAVNALIDGGLERSKIAGG